jgi:multiple sugar transport system substrate-binding protein
MKQMIDDFNAAHAGSIRIDATTLEWGTPFYAKVQTSAAIGEAPDIMTYHASRIPLALTQGVLTRSRRPTGRRWACRKGDFASATWDAVTIDGKQYAVPLDTHPIVLYYNKDLLGSRDAGRRRHTQGVGQPRRNYRHASGPEGERRAVSRWAA